MTLYVNGEMIGEDQIQAEFEKLRPEYDRVVQSESLEEHLAQLFEWSRENLIERTIMRQAAQSDPENISSEDIDQAYQELVEQNESEEKLFEQIDGPDEEKQQRIKRDIEQDIRLERLIQKISDQTPEPTDEEIRQYYDQSSERFMYPEMVRASHIVKHLTQESDPEKVRTEMQQVMTDLRNNGNFVELARNHSDCPDNGGDLGYFARGQMVQDFENVVFNLEIGETSEIFQTEFGFHIAKVTDKKDPAPCPLDEVRETIVEELTNQKQQKALEDFVDTEKAKATIEEK